MAPRLASQAETASTQVRLRLFPPPLITEGFMTAARDLADRFHQRWLRANPFAATMYGIPGYDDLLPDASEEGQQAWRAEAGHFLQEASAIAGELRTPADAVTLDCTSQAAAQEVAI